MKFFNRFRRAYELAEVPTTITEALTPAPAKVLVLVPGQTITRRTPGACPHCGRYYQQLGSHLIKYGLKLCTQCGKAYQRVGQHVSRSHTVK